MGDDVYEAQTAAGEVRVQFGWNRWVTIEVPGGSRKSAAIAKRAALERLLVECGVSEAEARVAAKSAWKQRRMMRGGRKRLPGRARGNSTRTGRSSSSSSGWSRRSSTSSSSSSTGWACRPPPPFRKPSGSRLDSLGASATQPCWKHSERSLRRRRTRRPIGGALKGTVSGSVNGPGGQSSRALLITSALRLSYFTIAWNGVIGAAALLVSTATHSLALAGFALNALLDSAASAILVWRFRRERHDPHAAERLERRAQTLIVVAMLLIALYVGFEAVRTLRNASHADESLLGVVLAVVSLLVLPSLGRRKLRVASAVSSRALRGDAVLTLAAAALAAITLVALLATGAFGWWWADPLAALIIAGFLGVEAVRVAIHHRFG